MDKLESVTGRQQRDTPHATRLAFAFSRNALIVALTGTIVALLTTALSVGTLYYERADVLRQANQNAANLARVISNDIGRNIELYDLSLRDMVDAAENPVARALPLPLRHLVTFDRAATATYLGGAYLIDASGKVTDQVSSGALPTFTVQDREYFTAQQQNPDQGLFISAPLRSREQGNPWMVIMSRRLKNPDGSFAGIASLSVQMAYFNAVLSKIDIGEHGSVFISNNEPSLIARKPYTSPEALARLRTTETFRRLMHQSSGSYSEVSPLDGERRLYNFVRIPNTPFIAVVAPSEHDALAPWRWRGRVIGTLSILLGMGVMLMSWVLAYSLREREKIQAELVDLAGSDPLTGLPNRRVFDIKIEEESRRARRTGAPTSMLFVDVDHFKAYNDTYGHAAGDRVLIEVGNAIKNALRRSTDLAARYGGEEFVLLLPETSEAGAHAVAENVRAAVARLAITHTASVFGIVTVSVGVSTVASRSVSGATSLREQSDEALYSAKKGGRNRVVASQE